MLFNLDLHPGYDNIFAALVGHAGTSGCTFITGIDRVWNVQPQAFVFALIEDANSTFFLSCLQSRASQPHPPVVTVPEHVAVLLQEYD